jgi:hypothetical protein
MPFRTIRTIVLALLCGAALSCRSTADAPPLKEVQRAKSGDIEVILLAKSDALKPAKDEAVLEFRTGSDHHLLDVGTVKVNATMPMAGMGPMLGNVAVTSGGTAGRYTLATDLGMAGSWRLTVEWDGPAGRGTVNVPGPVR